LDESWKQIQQKWGVEQEAKKRTRAMAAPSLSSSYSLKIPEEFYKNKFGATLYGEEINGFLKIRRIFQQVCMIWPDDSLIDKFTQIWVRLPPAWFLIFKS
jgi:hypothetical protein